jgi:non-ribosomal peptide synthetase component E (peptide arylation enzyme)
MPRYDVPEQIVFVEALRKTSVGKLDKKLLRERSAGLEGAPEGRK